MSKTTRALISLWCAATALCVVSLPVVALESIPQNVERQTQLPAAAGVDANYRLTEEDVLRLDVWNEQQLTNPQLQVTPDGKVNVAFIGPVQAAGLTQAELAASIAKKLEEAGIIENAKLQITLISVHRPMCRVLGAVGRPGEVVFKDGDTIMDAIAQAGSYQEVAWLERATLTHRGADKPIPIDLRKMFNFGDLSQNYDLQKGDTIYVPPETYENKIYVLGFVAHPGIYPIKENTTVLAALGLAGGPNERGSVRSTVVVRGDPAKPQRVKCDLTRLFDKADLSQDLVLKPGDVVLVPETKKPDWGKVGQLLSTITNIGYLRRYGLF